MNDLSVFHVFKCGTIDLIEEWFVIAESEDDAYKILSKTDERALKQLRKDLPYCTDRGPPVRGWTS